MGGFGGELVATDVTEFTAVGEENVVAAATKMKNAKCTMRDRFDHFAFGIEHFAFCIISRCVLSVFSVTKNVSFAVGFLVHGMQ
jgi:hypothetical protein